MALWVTLNPACPDSLQCLGCSCIHYFFLFFSIPRLLSALPQLLGQITSLWQKDKTDIPGFSILIQFSCFMMYIEKKLKTSLI